MSVINAIYRWESKNSSGAREKLRKATVEETKLDESHWTLDGIEATQEEILRFSGPEQTVAGAAAGAATGPEPLGGCGGAGGGGSVSLAGGSAER